MLDMISKINPDNFLFWFGLIISGVVGFLISIGAAYFNIKRQEKIRLKSKVIERDMTTIEGLISLTKAFGTMTLQEDRQIEDISLNYTCDNIDMRPISIPCILTEEWRASTWYTDYLLQIDTTTIMMSREIIEYEEYIKMYLLNAFLLYDRLPVENRWQMAFVLKPDFRNICTSFTRLLENHLQYNLYEMKQKRIEFNKKDEDRMQNINLKRIEQTNFYKYRVEFEKLYIVQA